MKLIDSVKWSGTDSDHREKAEVDSVTVHLPLRTPPSEDAFLVHCWRASNSIWGWVTPSRGLGAEGWKVKLMRNPEVEVSWAGLEGPGMAGAVVQLEVSEGLQDVQQAGQGVLRGLLTLPQEDSVPLDIFWVDP
ncbi:unnamed protein product [Arctogadus glacialis]